jgi:hypothetical protein
VMAVELMAAKSPIRSTGKEKRPLRGRLGEPLAAAASKADWRA